MAAGRKLASQGQWELAAYAFQAVTQAQPAYAEGWAYLGEALQHLEDPELAAEAPWSRPSPWTRPPYRPTPCWRSTGSGRAEPNGLMIIC